MKMEIALVAQTDSPYLEAMAARMAQSMGLIRELDEWPERVPPPQLHGCRAACLDYMRALFEVYPLPRREWLVPGPNDLYPPDE